ncbi:DnaJ domain-containing protein [Lipomyces kononenkoae]|uniref:DnaJ domain-containing protein n=1 Tax=Lipomyces kononenkoae TaxID=34357 RepID=A0ACC3T214_LIPKO
MALPDYYSVLNCKPTASQSQIRDAYKRAALATHPDRFPQSSTAAETATRDFQRVSDAYFVLGNHERRAEYDRNRKDEQASAGPPPAPPSSYFATDEDRQRTYQDEFRAAFEEMFRDSEFDTASFARGDNTFPTGEEEEEAAAAAGGASSRKFYTILAGLAGGVLGFTIANVPGALAGLAIGAKLGNIRDTKGKSVYEVFQELPREDRARVLAQMAQKVFSHVEL